MALTEVTFDGGTLVLFLLVPALFIVLAVIGFGLFLRTVGSRAAEWEEVPDEAEPAPGGREAPAPPWWGRPLVWLGVSAVLVVLGLYVAPQFLGGTFLFLPFVWVGGRRRGAAGPRKPAVRSRDESG